MAFLIHILFAQLLCFDFVGPKTICICVCVCVFLCICVGVSGEALFSVLFAVDLISILWLLALMGIYT